MEKFFTCLFEVITNNQQQIKFEIIINKRID